MSSLFDTLLREVERASAFKENPAASPLWLRAPSGLRRRFANGQIDADEFYRALSRWLEFEEQAA